MVLHGAERRPAVPFSGKLHVVELIAIHGGGTQGADLSGLHQRIQCLHGFLNGRVKVKAVDDIKVKVIRAQPLQGALNFPGNGPTGEPPLVEIDLRGDYHLVPGHCLFQGAAQIFLTGPGGIAVGGVEEVDAQVQGVTDHFAALFLVQRPVVHGPGLAEAHAPHAQPGYPNISAS